MHQIRFQLHEALPQTPLGELTALPQSGPDPSLYLRGLLLSGGNGREGKGKRGKER